MKTMQDLKRFITAQEGEYETALKEIKSGRKISHWMWYIFPQIKGLGSSEMSRYYAIRDLAEARDYLEHPVLGKRLKEISGVLLTNGSDSASEILGWPDDLKLHSCMTLFAKADKENPENIFERVITRFFKGKYDLKTLATIGEDQ